MICFSYIGNRNKKDTNLLISDSLIFLNNFRLNCWKVIGNVYKLHVIYFIWRGIAGRTAQIGLLLPIMYLFKKNQLKVILFSITSYQLSTPNKICKFSQHHRKMEFRTFYWNSYTTLCVKNCFFLLRNRYQWNMKLYFTYTNSKTLDKALHF